MWSTIRFGAQVAVLGAALVVAATHPTSPVERSDAAAGASGSAVTALRMTYVPPAVPPRPRRAAHVLRGVPSTSRPARPAPHPRHRGSTPHVATAARPRAQSTSFTEAVQAAVARVPTYRPGAARWVVSRAYAFWGTADWYHDVLYISPVVPRDKLYDVVVHEWSHELSVLDYSGDVSTATDAMNAWFGGSGLVGAERAADCMAILQGATWTHYTTCTDAHWRDGAHLLVSGRRL